MEEHELTEYQMKRLEEFVRFRMERMTYEHCSEVMKISKRTLIRWAKSPEYAKLWNDLKSEWRKTMELKAHEMGNLALITLADVMQHSRNDMARVTAAKLIGDWVKPGEADEDESDDRQEMLRLLGLLAEKKEQQALPDPDVIDVSSVSVEVSGPEESLPPS